MPVPAEPMTVPAAGAVEDASPTEFATCPKCAVDLAAPEPSSCPDCGLVFAKYRAFRANPVARRREPPAPEEPDPDALSTRIAERLLSPPANDSATLAVRAALIVLLVLWGLRIAAYDIRVGDMGASFMHLILLPIHEAGHVFFRLFGEFMMIAGGSLLQLLLPFGIGVAFLIKQRDAFGAAVCLWWSGASLVDLAPYVYDAWDPQLTLLGGHTGADGPHDWIYLLDSFDAIDAAQGLGRFVQIVGIVTMAAACGWAAYLLWRARHTQAEAVP